MVWTVYATGPRKAKNVILFIGDGLSVAHRTAARILSKGIAEGKSRGELAIDDMPHMALVSTAGSDSIVTDSANSASAYTTGHKSAVNAMGVYSDRTASPFDDPKVETIAELAKRRLGMAVGVVTNTEIEDATPAAMVAHTRRRADYDEIVEQFFAARPDVMMGGGSREFPAEGRGRLQAQGRGRLHRQLSRRRLSSGDDEVRAGCVGGEIGHAPLLGLFATGNMDGALDRKFLKGGGVKKFPDQPDLTEQVQAALNVLSRNEAGFFLMVESGMIDKYAHLARHGARRLRHDHARQRGSPDARLGARARRRHADPGAGGPQSSEQPRRHHQRRHGTTPNVPLRERVGVYEKAGFPNYPAPDADGYPSRVDVSRAACDLLRQPAGPLRDLPPQARRSERADGEGRAGGQLQGQ